MKVVFTLTHYSKVSRITFIDKLGEEIKNKIKPKQLSQSTPAVTPAKKRVRLPSLGDDCENSPKRRKHCQINSNCHNRTANTCCFCNKLVCGTCLFEYEILIKCQSCNKPNK